MFRIKITPKRRFLIIFLILNLLLSIFFIDKWNNWNSVSRALPIMAYFEQGNFQLDKYHELTGDISYINGHYYTDKAPMATIIVLPFYKALVGLRIITRHNSELDLIPINVVAGILCSTIPFVLLLFFMIKELINKKTRLSPIFIVMLPVYGSLLFVFTGTFFSHLLSGIFILIAYLELKKDKFFWAGILTGLAFATEFPLGVFIPIWALIILIKELSLKKTLIFAIGTLPFVLFILFYNYYYTGSAFTMLYKYEAIQGFADEFNQTNTIFGFGVPRPENIWEMFFGQFKGLFFYIPILLLIFIHVYNSLPEYKLKKITLNYFLIPIIAFTFLIISKSVSWWGGWSYGPRYLIPICILIAYEGLIFLSKKDFNKPIFFIISIFGLICAWMAKVTVVTGIPSEEKYPVFGYVYYSFKNKNFNPNNLLSMGFKISPQISAYCWFVLLIGSIIWLNYEYKKLSKKTFNLNKENQN